MSIVQKEYMVQIKLGNKWEDAFVWAASSKKEALSNFKGKPCY